MTIKEVSEKYGLSQETLRYYERVGILPNVCRTAGGIRNYTEKDLPWIALAAELKHQAMPIQVMLRYMEACKAEGFSGEMPRRILEDYQGELLEKRKQMDETLQWLAEKIHKSS